MLDGFDRTEHTALGETRVVYRRGRGPGVVVMHEVPGITPQVARFARRLADDGFEVALPVLFGEVNRPLGVRNLAREMARACVSREFAVLSRGGASPITDWLRDLARDLADRTKGPVGALGMCITGNFALALMIDPWVAAPVLSQPSLPVPLSTEHAKGLHVCADDLACVKRRTETEGRRVLGLRFTTDPLCTAARFGTLRETFGEAFEAIEIDSSFGNAHGIPPVAHSVLAHDLVDEEGHPTRAALERVLSFFHQQLDRPSEERIA